MASRGKAQAKRRASHRRSTPAIIVHEAAHVEAALAAAAALGLPNVTVSSADGAAAYLGPAGFAAMIADAAARYPGLGVTAILDCGAAPGHALAALRIGIRHISFDTRSIKAAAAIASIAAKSGAAVVPRAGPGSLDLYGHGDPAQACRDWLAAAPQGMS